MAKKSHPYIDALKISALIFFVLTLVIVFLALYVNAVAKENQTIDPARVEKNLTPPGHLYSR
ncbi:MAG: hypothetical protein ACR2PV_02220 [Gammaproteobacteria bacterium]